MNAAGAPLLQCRNLSKYFGALAAVKDLSFDVAEGEILGIGGPNGAGKTTLFEMISGLSPASEGEILFEGRDVARLAPERKPSSPPRNSARPTAFGRACASINDPAKPQPTFSRWLGSPTLAPL